MKKETSQTLRFAPLAFGALLAAAGLAACKTVGDYAYWRGEGVIVPVPQPVYSSGDTFVYDEEGKIVAETVVSATPDTVTWINDKSASWTAHSVPFLQARDFSKHSGAVKVERTYSKAATEFFPLMIGKRVRYSVAERTLGIDDVTQNTNECEVVSQVNVYVRAGTFDTYEIHCDMGGRFKSFYYAPKVNNNVLTIEGGLFDKKIKELVSFKRTASAEKAPQSEIPAEPEEEQTSQLEEPAEAVKKQPTKRKKRHAAPPPREMSETPAAYHPAAATRQPAPPAIKMHRVVPASMQRRPALRQAPPMAMNKRELLRRASLRAENFETETGGRRGTRRALYGVQLGAFSSQRNARLAWRKFANDSPGLLSGLVPRYQEYVPPDGRARFTRVIVGEYTFFQDAKSMCGRLKRNGLDCWSVGLR